MDPADEAFFKDKPLLNHCQKAIIEHTEAIMSFTLQEVSSKPWLAKLLPWLADNLTIALDSLPAARTPVD